MKTPRTDSKVGFAYEFSYDLPVVEAGVARQLERDLVRQEQVHTQQLERRHQEIETLMDKNAALERKLEEAQEGFRIASQGNTNLSQTITALKKDLLTLCEAVLKTTGLTDDERAAWYLASELKEKSSKISLTPESN